MKPNGSPTPPRPLGPHWADRLLEWFVAPHLLEDVQGDLQEAFHKRVAQVGLARARREYGWAVLHYLTPFFYKRNSNDYSNPATTDMLRNYLKIAFRKLSRNRQSTFLNLTGLSTGLACSLLIFMWVNDELSVDKFNKKDNQLYRILWNLPLENGMLTLEQTPYPLGAALVGQMPEVD